jgi:hypothetical protein
VVFPEGFPLSQILPKEFVMLPNEVFALACRAHYDEIGLVVDEKNGQFAHCPYPKGMGETGHYLLWEHHQQQGLLQSRDIDERCFFNGDAKKWLEELDHFPDDYFGLWDIYETYSGSSLKKLHEGRDKDGKSLHALELNKKLHEKRDENGKSLHSLNLHKGKNADGKSLLAQKAAEASHKSKDENGKSLLGIENAKRVNESMTPEQRRERSRKAGKKASTQVWKSLVDGFTGSAGNVAYHNKTNGWDPGARVRAS